MFLNRTATGSAIVTTSDMADFLRVTDTDEHQFIGTLVEAATLWAEAYTHRDFRANSYELLRTNFGDTDLGYNPLELGYQPLNFGYIALKKATVASVTEVAYLKDDVFTVVPTSVWYLQRGLTRSLVQLKEGQTWPTDEDHREQNVRVRFNTGEPENIDLCRAGVMRHVSLMYADRGDMDSAIQGSAPSNFSRVLAHNTGMTSGAAGLYDALIVPGL